MMPNIPDRKLTAAASMAANVTNFLSAGGKIATLPGFEYRPLPPRRKPAPSRQPTKAAKRRLTEDQRLANRLKALADERYTLRYACMITGIAEREARRVAEKFNIRFRAVPGKS